MLNGGGLVDAELQFFYCLPSHILTAFMRKMGSSM